MKTNDTPPPIKPLDDNHVEDAVIIEQQQHQSEVKRRRAEQIRRVGPGADYEPEQEKCW